MYMKDQQTMFDDPMHIHDTPAIGNLLDGGSTKTMRLHDSGTAGKTVRIADGAILTLSHQVTGKGSAQVMRSMIRIDREVVVGTETVTVSSYNVTVRPLSASILDAAKVARAVAGQVLGIGSLGDAYGTIEPPSATDITVLDLERFLVGEP